MADYYRYSGRVWGMLCTAEYLQWDKKYHDGFAKAHGEGAVGWCRAGERRAAVWAAAAALAHSRKVRVNLVDSLACHHHGPLQVLGTRWEEWAAAGGQVVEGKKELFVYDSPGALAGYIKLPPEHRQEVRSAAGWNCPLASGWDGAARRSPPAASARVRPLLAVVVVLHVATQCAPCWSLLPRPQLP